MNNLFIKNFYYNKTTIIKLIYLYSFLNEGSFFDELVSKLQSADFSNFDEKTTKTLAQIYESLTPNLKKIELNFGYIWIFENKCIFFFKTDFIYEDFFKFFENLGANFQINWLNLEFYDKQVKILEIFKGDNLNIKPFLRNFREEIIDQKSSKKIKRIKKIAIDIENRNFLVFLKNYNDTNIKLILNFAS